ncbi:MAG: hypothetical protein JWM65_3835 [Sphingomonas bacterium]|nr:hypothetical protein [Sphingomonas bacterium]
MKASLLSLLLAMGATSAAQQGPQILLHDPVREVDIRYDMAGPDVVFSAELPVGWSFTVAIDGDRNGVWGNGAGMGAAEHGTTADRKYGRDQDGSFCAQTILASFPNDPNQILVSTDCDGLPSKGHLEWGQRNARQRATMTLKVPASEIFGKNADAHLQICLWDTKAETCSYSPTKPYVLKAPTAAP